MDGTFSFMTADDSVFKLRRIKPSTLDSLPYELWQNKKIKFTDMLLWEYHICIIHNDNNRQNIDPTGFLGHFKKFSGSSKMSVFYNTVAKFSGRSSNIFYDETNIGNNKKTPDPGQ